MRPDPIRFDPQELALFADQSLFRTKARIGEKIRGTLEQLHEALRNECRTAALQSPEGFDLDKCQFVKGEHLDDHPYQYLDYPKYFQGEIKFTFRSLIWWGHHVTFAWLLEGGHLADYKRRLLGRYPELAGRDLELGLAPSLWEWKRGPGYTLPLLPGRRSQVAAVLERRASLKISRVILPQDPLVAEGRLPEIGCRAFRSMLPIVGSD